MSLKKFGHSDIVRNAMRAYPHSNFFIYSSLIYYDHRPIESGSFSDDILSASGGISLFEYNVDRAGTTKFHALHEAHRAEGDVEKTGLNPPIIPYVVKGSSKNYLKSAPRSRTLTEGTDFQIIASGPMQEVADDYSFLGEGPLTGSSYAMTSSITRELMTTAGDTGSIINVSRPVYRHYYGLRNTLNFYGTRSPHYLVNFSDTEIGTWNKDEQDLNLISIPKIFYGSRIKHGSMSLKFYITGTLIGELKDEKYNGELVQVGPVGSIGSGSVAGVALYEEGFVILTGSWDMTPGDAYAVGSGISPRGVYWKDFAAGANDGNGPGSVDSRISFGMSFKGHTETQVLTMYAHARRGEVNYSNNPTFLEFGQTKTFLSSSKLYIENDNQTIKNIVSSSYSGQTADFERQVYISRVAIYDDEKKLIGVATLSNPVLKKEAQDLSFKLKLDI